MTLGYWRRGGAIAGMAGVLATVEAPALAADDDAGAPAVVAHGFVSQGFMKSAYNNYLAQDSKSGSFEFTEAGINFTAPLSDELTAGLQLFARDLGPLGNYKPQFDWYYLDYHWRDWFGVRAGRTKIPFGLYNESSDVDAARVPVLLPQSIYPVGSRDYLLAQTGGELYGNIHLASLGQLEYRTYGGTIHIDASDADDIQNLTVRYVFGGRLMWLTPVTGLQVGASAQTLRLDFDYVPPADVVSSGQSAGALPADFSGSVPSRINATLAVASVEYTAGDLILASEYSRWFVNIDSTLTALVPASETVSERYYIMGSYRMAPWFAPGLYYSIIFPNSDERSGRSNYQHDLALSFRYDLTPHWLLKLEGHYMHGTAALSSALNGGVARARLPPDWGLFLLKTTAYF